MDRKKIVLDVLCFESFFKASIGNKLKCEIFYLHESSLFFFVKKFYTKYFGVKFTNLGNLSYSENRLGSRSIYEAIQEETKRDIFSFLESKSFKKNLSTYLEGVSFNDQKLNYFLLTQLYPFFYKTREILSIVEFEDIKPDIFLVRRSTFDSLSIKNTNISIQNYEPSFSYFFPITKREDSLYDGLIYQRYNSFKSSLIIKDFFKKIKIFTNYFIYKDSDITNSNLTKKSDHKNRQTIGIELLQSRINLSETNDLFFIDSSIIQDDQICLIEYDEKFSLETFFPFRTKKKHEPKMKYGKESYNVVSNRNFSRLKILNVINFFNQKYSGEVNDSYRIKNLGSLIGSIRIFNYLASIMRLLFHYKNQDKYLKFLLKQYEFNSNYYSKIFEEANLKILWTMFDGAEDQLTKSQAIESVDGFFCGSHWSHFPNICVDNHRCYDILFTWSDHFSKMLNEYYQSRKTFIVGYPSTDYLDKYVDQANRIRKIHSDKFIITFNDNTYFNDGPVSKESYNSFYSLALEILEEFENTIIYFKPKRSNHFKAYLKNNKKLEKFLDQERVHILIADHSRSKVPPTFPALFSDLVIGLGLSTTTIESTISGALSYNIISQSVFKNNDFYQNGLDKVVFNTKKSARKAINKAMIQKDNDIYLKSLEYYKILDPFMDDKARIRISEGLHEILNTNYSDLQ